MIVSQRERIVALFTDDAAVRAHAVQLMPLTTFYSILSTMSCGWSQQLLFGLGARLRVPASINCVAFFGVGLPVGTVLAYQAGFGVRGVWVGLLLSIAMIVLGQYSYLYATTDFEMASKVARERALNKEQSAPAAGGAESEMRGLAAADSAKGSVAVATKVTSSTAPEP